MRRSPGPRALQHLLGLGSSGFRTSAAPLVSASLEPLLVPSWRSCGRLGSSSHWRGFAQQAGGEQEAGSSSQGSSSKASDEGAKAEADAEASKGENGEAKAGADEGKAEEAEAEAEATELTPEERLHQELEEFQAKSAAKKKELLLGLADFENTKKKSMKERESRRRAATANFARRMIDVYREFENLPAFKNASSEGKAEGSPVLALKEGVDLTRDLFSKALEKSDVERLPVEPGTPVVNARHEVVGSTPGDGSLPERSIAEVTEDGWIMDLRSQAPQVLHKAKVKTVGAEA